MPTCNLAACVLEKPHSKCSCLNAKSHGCVAKLTSNEVFVMFADSINLAGMFCQKKNFLMSAHCLCEQCVDHPFPEF